MSGLPDCNYPAFHDAAHYLRCLGYSVVNPAENGLPQDAPWEEHMRVDLKQLLDCDGLAVLPGHENSRGARLEIELSQQLGLSVGSVNMWTIMAQNGCEFAPQHTANSGSRRTNTCATT